MRVRAIEQTEYDGKKYQPGELFECADDHAHLFTLMHKVEKATEEEKPVAKRGRYARRDMRAES